MIFFLLFHKYTTCQKALVRKQLFVLVAMVVKFVEDVLWVAPTRRVFLCCSGTLFLSWIIYFSKECEGEFAGNL